MVTMDKDNRGEVGKVVELVTAVTFNEGYRIEGIQRDSATASVIDADPTKNVFAVYYTVPLEIKAGSGSKQYDGIPLTVKTFTAEGLVNGDTLAALTIDIQTSVTNVTPASGIDNVIDSYTAPAYYRVETKAGNLKITKAPLTIKVIPQVDYIYNQRAQGEDGTAAYADAEILEKKVEVTGLKGGDMLASITLKGTRTDAGTTMDGIDASDPVITTNRTRGEATGNYDITIIPGDLAVKPAELTVMITGNNDAKDYIGEEQKVTGYEISIPEGAKLTKDEITGPEQAEAIASGKDANGGSNADKTYPMGLTEDDFGTTNTNYIVTFKVTDGWLQINPINATVDITGNYSIDTYDSEKHSVEGYEVKKVSDLYDEAYIAFNGTAYAERTEQGQTDMGLDETMFSNTNANFATVTFNVTDGFEKIEPIDEVTVIIKGAQSSDPYDGEEHTVTGYEVVKISNKLYTAADFSFSGEQTAKRTEHGTTSMGLTPEMFTNNNPNFSKVTFIVEDGYQEITRINATVAIVGNNDVKPYDGEEHTVTGYEVTSIQVDGKDTELYTTNDFSFSGEAKASRTIAGTTDMGLAEDQFTNLNENFRTVTFVITDGYQQIDPIDATVTITEHSGEADYDGEEHTVTGYDVTSIRVNGEDTMLYTANDFTFNGTAIVSGTDADSYDMELKPEDFANNNRNFRNVTFVIADGKLVINPINVTVTVAENSGKAVYDGEEHTVTGYEVTSIQIDGEDTELYTADDFTFSGSANVAGTNAGTYDMELKPEDFTNNNDNFANVTFVITDGVLEITPRPVTVKADDKTKVYDNDEATDPELTATVTGAVEGETINYTLGREEGENAGEYPITVTAGENPNYTVTVEDGVFSIAKVGEVHVKINGHGGAFTYNAANRTVTGYDVEIDNPLFTEADFLFVGDATVTARNAGTYSMGLDASDFMKINDNFDTVIFEVTNEPVVIAPKAATITVVDKTKVYGDKDPMLTAAVEGLEGTDAAVLMMTREAGEDVGTYAINATVAADRNYIFTIVPGTLNITPKAITVTAEDKAKVFGENDPELTAMITGLADGDSADLITYTISREDGENADAYAINVTGEANQGNYTVTFEPAEMTIAPEGTVIVRIAANNGTFQYDGTERDLSGYSVEINNELYSEEAFTFTGSSELKAKNAGTYRTAMTAGDFTNTDPNFENVVFEVTNGELVITKRLVTLASGDAEKAYDGTTLRNNAITVGGDGFAENEGLIFNVTGQITNPGTAENTFDWIPAGGTLAANYEFTKTTGTLTVLPGTTHTLHITYADEGGDVIGTFEKAYAPGERYSIVTEHMTGYEVDTEIVAGVMGDADINVTVTYSLLTYTLTITFPAFGENRDVHEPIVLYLHKDDTYRVAVPPVEGYKALVKEVAGTMPPRDREIAVTMLGEDVTVEIPEDPTPLGVSNAVLGSGEVIE